MSDQIVSVPIPTHKRFRNLLGQRFERLEVIAYAGMRRLTKQNGAYWWCRCDCGEIKALYSNALTHGKHRSCNCLHSDTSTALKFKHGEAYSVEYMAIKNAIQRCHNPETPNYHLYGGRGIRVCQEWRDDMSLFVKHIGRKPTPRHTLDRIETNGHYEPGNVKWSTYKQQIRNRRITPHLTYRGITQSVGDWADSLGVSPQILFARRKRGWSDDKIIITPILDPTSKTTVVPSQESCLSLHAPDVPAVTSDVR